MTSPSSRSAAATTPPRGGGRRLLRAARLDQGWSQAVAARELSALAARTGAAVAGAASLKTQLSRWENGHATPEPEYRALLGALYDRDPAGLGLLVDGPAPADLAEPGGPLTSALAEAGALDDTALGLLREQVEATARLDHRLGPAGVADVLTAQVEQLVALADHVLAEAVRGDVCTLLAEAARLSGDLERDRARTTASWARYGTARAAALEAGRPDLAARARAGRAGLLVDAGEPDRARTLLGDADDAWSVLVRSEADARPPAGTAPDEPAPDEPAPDDPAPDEPAPAGLPIGRTGSGRTRMDAIRPGVAVEVDAIRHRRDLARATAGDGEARTALERAAADEERPVRERAESSAVLARTLHRDGRSAEALIHARRAHLLALRIGAPRIAALVADVLGAGQPEPDGRGRTVGAG